MHNDLTDNRHKQYTYDMFIFNRSAFRSYLKNLCVGGLHNGCHMQMLSDPDKADTYNFLRAYTHKIGSQHVGTWKKKK